ncbi:hydroxyacid dehydrogenase [Maritimibacter sp. 55A14]|uniref:FAD-binding oxidoreductase n=1 Tax=Maritimibacter sp. 55A14 TaxID=2174844 RepID=UPI000D6165B6|nr:FAD-binding oxidoreductase [Maritimibacter sp. 55A14]PWE33320.1 hydroxyacid dehydrogenase [Maritimibacter sp. 55A14]
MTLAPVTEDFARRLRGLLPEAAFRDYAPGYREEPRGRFHGAEALLVAPASAAEVAEVVRACAAARVGIVPYGGGTGLVGGQIVPEGPKPVLLSLERMRTIREVRAGENTLVAEAGAVLADVQRAAEEAGRLFPLSIASEGSARMGGILSANAGGVNTLRYGTARALCLGLEAVLPDGAIWHGSTRLRKDNAGYDLRDLLIGAEGTLGIITAASMRLHPRPAAMRAGFVAVPDPQAALRLLALADERLGGAVSAFELIHRQSFDFLTETMPDLRQPFDAAPDWAVLMDIGAPAALDVDAALERLVEEATGAGLILDGVLAQSEAQRAEFWALREAIPEANRRIGSVSSHDISVPLGAIPDFIECGRAAVARIGSFRINCFGHVGDGNLHYNVFPPKGGRRADHEAVRPAIKRAVHDLAHELGGSVAAEHGIGRLKVEDLERYGDPAKLAAMRAIKAALDPAGIMNPGAMLR